MKTSVSHVNFSFLEFVQQDNVGLPGDDFSNFNEMFQDPSNDDFELNRAQLM